jgi:NADP-dependent 3-hydroxy acid dehydrogenase YdfG
LIARGFSGKIIPSIVDIRDSKAVDDWVANAANQGGKLDGAANVAGVNGSGNYTMQNVVLNFEIPIKYLF